MEQQIEDLRERMRLLQQDRRANVDLLGEFKFVWGKKSLTHNYYAQFFYSACRNW